MWVGVNDPPLLLVRCFACQVVLDGACYGCGTSLRKFFITTNKIQLGGFMFFLRALLWQAYLCPVPSVCDKAGDFSSVFDMEQYRVQKVKRGAKGVVRCSRFGRVRWIYAALILINSYRG